MNQVICATCRETFGFCEHTRHLSGMQVIVPCAGCDAKDARIAKLEERLVTLEAVARVRAAANHSMGCQRFSGLGSAWSPALAHCDCGLINLRAALAAEAQ